MSTRQEKAQDFRIDSSQEALENLTDFLEPHGLDPESLSEKEQDRTFDEENQLVDVGHLRDLLPEELEDGENGAYIEVDRFYESIPRNRRAGGVEVHADKLLSMLMERMEFFGTLMERVTRTCGGQQCDVYDACPFTDDGDGVRMVENATPEDDMDCLVERQRVNDLKDSLLKTADNPDGRVDPRRPTQAMLFENLVEMMLHRERLNLELQQSDVTVEVRQAVQTRGSGVEELRQAGVEVHPALEALEVNMRRVESVMDRMGISPQFLMRNDRWIEEDDEQDVELRARKMTKQFLREAKEKVKEDLPPGSEQRKVIEAMIEEAGEQAEGYEDGSDENGSDTDHSDSA